jgi:hypothetical protein
MIWIPTGKPVGEKPKGNDSAGKPVSEMIEQDCIQSI